MWEVRYLPEVEKWLDSLTTFQFKLVTKELLFLKRLGSMLGMPHSRALGGGLFELRERSFGFRVYYTFQKNKCVILVCAGDKKSQTRDIKKARLRMEEL